jgi:CRISPR-associated endonuclease/helicase Cas3
MAKALSAADFSHFFEAIHGYEPFPWQRRLLEVVLKTGWPSSLDVPTGAGKTAAIDVAVFQLAVDAEATRTKPVNRRAPVRILFIVDRRLVVDDAYERAAKIARALVAPSDPVLVRVAHALTTLAEQDGPPVRAVRLRGGMPREPDWVRTPLQPSVVVSTVDQVGSRLLFRGYGVSDSMKPVHAGLLGTDSLILLDEAHLSQPFIQTVRDAHKLETGGTEVSAARRSRIVSLSATQQEAAPRLLTAADYKHRVLGPRLRASKRAQLVSVDATASSPAFVDAFVERAVELAAHKDVKVVAVIVNRVGRAREIHRRLLKMGEATLLTGRTRELDRQAQMHSLMPRIRAGRDAHAATTLFVVATQCVEAGADLDFDALVTEIAPIDALRQRFGRVNRMGRGFVASAYVLAARDQAGKRPAEDATYGDALAHTWALLQDHADKKSSRSTALPTIDFGIEESKRWLPPSAALGSCLCRPAPAPLLMRPHLMLWNYTAPRPAADPLVSLYLHGLRSAAGDVQIVWRADLTEAATTRELQLLNACPPSSLEALSLPLGEARRWLFGGSGDADGGELADLEGVEPGARPVDHRAARKRALRWSSSGSKQIDSYELRAGDIIVIPAARGGCDEWGWNPASSASVADLGRAANLQQRGRDIYRLSIPSPGLSSEEPPDATSDLTDDELLAKLLPKAQFPSRTSRRNLRVVRSEDGSVLAVERRVAHSELASGATGQLASDSTTENDESVVGNVSVTLVEHSRGVEAFARDFARSLPQAQAEDVITAAFLHDAGKAWHAFSLWLHGGDELSAEFGPALAKSSHRLDGAARTKAGLPKGARHELASLRLAVAHPRFAAAFDQDLVLWLIGTHHGHGRPFFPSVEWPPQNETCTVDLGDCEVASSQAVAAQHLSSGWVDMFHRLIARYGMWGLAHMEATLRLADHRRSEWEQLQ